MSIGFETLQSSMDGDVRQLKELKLWEVSVVTFPMNESATIQSVKTLSLNDDEVQHHLGAIRRHQKAIHGHVKVLLGADDLDDGAADSAFLEGNDSEAAARQMMRTGAAGGVEEVGCASRGACERLTQRD